MKRRRLNHLYRAIRNTMIRLRESNSKYSEACKETALACRYLDELRAAVPILKPGQKLAIITDTGRAKPRPTETSDEDP